MLQLCFTAMPLLKLPADLLSAAAMMTMLVACRSSWKQLCLHSARSCSLISKGLFINQGDMTVTGILPVIVTSALFVNALCSW